MSVQNMPRKPQDCDREELLGLLADAAKNWLAHDGLWFLEVEKAYGMETAIRLDKAAWASFTVLALILVSILTRSEERVQPGV